MLGSSTPRGSHTVYTFGKSRGRIRAYLQIIENIVTDVYTLRNVHCTNLEISRAGYSPSNKWCLPHRPSNMWCSPKLRRIDMIAWKLIYQHRPHVLADRVHDDIDIHSASLWKIEGFFFLLFILRLKFSRVARHIIMDFNSTRWEAECDTYTHLMPGWVWQARRILLLLVSDDHACKCM